MGLCLKKGYIATWVSIGQIWSNDVRSSEKNPKPFGQPHPSPRTVAASAMAVEDQQLIADAQNEERSAGGWRRASGPLVLGLLGSNLLFLGVWQCRMILEVCKSSTELWLALLPFVYRGQGATNCANRLIANVNPSWRNIGKQWLAIWILRG